MGKLRWGIVSTGRIARTFAVQLGQSERGVLTAVASRSDESAEAFANDFLGVRACGSYESLLEGDDIDALYIATPHPQHVEWAIKGLEAGKHVLCEKPLGINHAEAMALVEAAQERDVFLMEGFMYRVHPQTERLRELLIDEVIGEVRHLRASFGYHARYDAKSRLFRSDLAGGGIMDVGCYTVSMARMVAGAATQNPYLDPESVSAHGHIEDGVDRWASALLSFAGDICAQVSTACSLSLDNALEIYGSRGTLRVPSPWFCGGGREGGTWEIEILRSGGESEIISEHEPRGLFTIEADRVAEEIGAGRRECAVMSWADSLGNARTLDAWRREIGLTFASETPAGWAHTVTRRPLRRGDDHRMRYGDVPGLNKSVSRLVMGCDNQTEMPQASVMFDHFFEHGGNAFDTAYIYGRGMMERLLGQWMRHRGLRDELVVIGKGAHTPLDFPRHVAPQLSESLDRLQTDHVDVYFLHRDNEDVPVAEWVDALNEEVRAGRVGVFGGSNWSEARIREANAYADSNGLRGFSAVSNNFSLARMNEPIWTGCIAASTPVYRKFLSETGLALMPWSSQARGFFTARAEQPEDARGVRGLEGRVGNQPQAEEMARVWFSDDNFERRRRAGVIADERGVEMINVALAYVLCQPFPTFPLIGPRQLSETRSCLRALSIDLTPGDVAWLDLQTDDRVASR
jgi:predicted dehydrogenase/aryl-alcohol dehydrogenase-like predicted oxidoreductase